MPIYDHPFGRRSSFEDARFPLVTALVRNSHDHSRRVVQEMLIDTGSDTCSFPIHVGVELGHNHKKSLRSDTIEVVGGETLAHTHTVDIFLFDYREIDQRNRGSIYTMKPNFSMFGVEVDFVVTLKRAILGTHGFLNERVLIVDYPRGVFSII